MTLSAGQQVRITRVHEGSHHVCVGRFGTIKAVDDLTIDVKLVGENQSRWFYKDEIEVIDGAEV